MTWCSHTESNCVLNHTKVSYYQCTIGANVWRAVRVSNPEPLVLETNALPIELTTHVLFIWYRWRESNPRLNVRSVLFSPLNYSDIVWNA